MQIDGILDSVDQSERIRLILQGLVNGQITLIDAEDEKGQHHMVMCCNDKDLGNIAVLDEDRAFLISERLLELHGIQ